MILITVVIIAVVVVMLALRPGRRDAGASQPNVTAREADFWSRPGSFSFLIFEGDVREAIPEFLRSCEYTVVEATPVSGPFGEVYDSIATPQGTANEVVSKVAYPIWKRTVLIDPEMVMLSLNRKEIAAFCRSKQTRAIGVIWERFSETIMLELHGQEGLQSSTTLIADVPQEGNMAPNLVLLGDPTLETLLRVLRQMGVSIEQLFGTITGLKYKLEEHAQVPGA